MTDKGEQPWSWWPDDEDGTAEPEHAPDLAGDDRDDTQPGSPPPAPSAYPWSYQQAAADDARQSNSYRAPGYDQPWRDRTPGYDQPWRDRTPGNDQPEYGPFPKRRTGRSLAIAAGVVGLLIVAVAGGFVGHALTASHPPTTASSAGNPSSGGGSTSGGGLGFGGGFPQSGRSGSPAPTGSGAGPSDAAAIASQVDPGLVDINTTVYDGQAEAAGTGMVLTADGEVLTNNHVIEGATSISVTDVGNGMTYPATVVGYSVASDVAVIRLAGASGLQTVTTASAAASVGEQVVGIGNAGGTGGTPSYAGGTVTATDQSIMASDDLTGTDEQLTGMVETNADIKAGDSGGSLVNDSGQVIGMDTAGSQSFQFAGQAQGTGFAIPIATATSIAGQIVAGDSSSSVHVGPTAFLGIQVGQASSGGYGGGNNSVSGVPVGGVVANSAAAEAGLAEGDVITSVGGYTVTSQSALQDVLVDDMSPGLVVTVVYTDSAGQQHSVTLTLGTGPAA